MPQPRTERGFSLIELLVVILMIAVIAAIAIPNIASASNSYQVLIAANALEQHLNRARQEAVRRNLRMDILVTEGSYQIDTNRDGDFDSEDDPAALVVDGVSLEVVSPTDGLVTFTSRGEMLVGVNPVFVFSRNGRERTVRIDPRGAVVVGAEVAGS